MSRHVLDHATSAQSHKSFARFLRLERFESFDGVSRLIAGLDRMPKTREGAKLPAFVQIDRGRTAWTGLAAGSQSVPSGRTDRGI